MTIVEELREQCKELACDREKELKVVLSDYFYSSFMERHKPFRAVIGNKKCKPIPIHRDFATFSGKTVVGYEYVWPNYSEVKLRRELEKLGFVVTEKNISISVPPHKKGEKLSFAQEWVKKINDRYSEYCADEKKAAKEIYSEFISELISAPDRSKKTCCGYTLFCDFKFNREISPKCATFVKRLMMHDQIRHYYVEGEYKGIIVFDSTPIN